MAVKKIGEKYRCNVCGNEVLVTKVGGGTLVCCGEEMELLGAELKEEHEEEELEEEEDEWEKHEEEEDLQ